MLEEFTATVIDATGAAVPPAIVNPSDPCLPSLVTVIVADPAEIAVTIPDADTVAAAGFDDAHVIARPDSVLPCASRSVTVI
jgi:hypothetical protein